MPNYPPIGAPNGALAADYLRRDPITGKVWLDVVGYYLEQLRMTPERSTASASQIAALIPATIRPLQGLQPNQRGQGVFFGPLDILQPKGVFRVESKGDDAEQLTVTLGVTPAGDIPVAGAGPDATFQAIVTWGVGGASFTATVDVVRGTTISVVANHLDVSVVRLPPILGETSVQAYTVAAAVGYTGTGRGLCPARFTDTIGTIASGFSAVSIIPNQAVNFTVLQDAGAEMGPIVYKDLRIDVLVSTSGALLSTYEVATNANTAVNSENQFPIPNGAQVLVITNLADDDAFVNVVYALAM